MTKLYSESNYMIRQSSCALACLQTRVFENHNLSICTKIKVYTAVCLSLLLYGGESWTLYASHLKDLEACHIRALQFILNDTWIDRTTHEETDRRTGNMCLESQKARYMLVGLATLLGCTTSACPSKCFT